MADLVEMFPKTGKRSTQALRRAKWETEWRRNRAAAMKAAEGRCQLPGCDRRADVVHHRAGRRVADANDLAMLMPLCNACHQSVHASPESSYANGWLVKRT